MRSEKPSSKRGLIQFALLALFIGLVALGTRAVLGYFAGPADFSGPGSGATTITVHAGDSLSVVGNALKEQGVVASVDAFVQAATANPESQSMQPGTYTLRDRMRASDALALILSRKTRVSNAITIPEGLTVREIVALLARRTHIAPRQWAATVKNAHALGLPRYAQGKPEGYLFPATYELAENQTASDVVRTMLGTFASKVAPLDLESAARRIKMSPAQVITVASLIQAEAHPRDYAKVARVVYNRLAIDMPLQFDSTVNYGLGTTHVILTTEQLAQDTPYNMYVHTGLPPTPINNPGLSAITAALKPAQGDWLYFVTVNLQTQETKFSHSYAQFLRDKDEFLAYCRKNPSECQR